jgi:hypothetical protein
MGYPLLAIGFPSSKEVGEFGMNCLAVAGGFAVGYLLGAIASYSLDRWAFNRKSPDIAKKTLRVLAGIALALLIAFLAFRGGSGGGWGGGSGPEGPGSSGSPDDGKTHNPAHSEERPQPKIDMPKSPLLHPDDPKVRITFLGGDAVQGDRFYLIDEETVPRTFAEVKAFVQKREEAESRPLTLIVQFPSNPRQRIDPNSINVTQVTSWAEMNGIGVYKPGK